MQYSGSQWEGDPQCRADQVANGLFAVIFTEFLMGKLIGVGKPVSKGLLARMYAWPRPWLVTCATVSSPRPRRAEAGRTHGPSLPSRGNAGATGRPLERSSRCRRAWSTCSTSSSSRWWHTPTSHTAPSSAPSFSTSTSSSKRWDASTAAEAADGRRVPAPHTSLPRSGPSRASCKSRLSLGPQRTPEHSSSSSTSAPSLS